MHQATDETETPDEEGIEETKLRAYYGEIVELVVAVMQDYAGGAEARKDRRNLWLYRGEAWSRAAAVDPIADIFADGSKTPAAEDEIYPVLDALTAAMAQETPHAAVNPTGEGGALDEEKVKRGRLVAANLNAGADKDNYGKTLRRLVRKALVFDKGGILKVTPDLRVGLVRGRTLLPWNVFVDGNVEDIADAGWLFERTAIPFSQFEELVESGVYSRPTKPVKPDAVQIGMPAGADGLTSGLNSRSAPDRAKLLRQVALFEFWDVMKGRLLHIVAASHEVVMDVEIPYRLPYYFLWFDPDIGQPKAISAVSRLAQPQRIIDEFVNGQIETGRRQVPKTFVDERMFKDDAQKAAYKTANAWDVTFVAPQQGDRNLKDFIETIPGAVLSPETHAVISDQRDYMQRVIGYQFRGPANVRTAEEVTSIVKNADARVKSRMTDVVDAVKWWFEQARLIYAWMLRSYSDLNVDIEAMWKRSSGVGDIQDWYDALIDEDAPLSIEPFAPTMKNDATIAEFLNTLLPLISSNPTLSSLIDLPEFLKSLFSIYGIPPQTLAEPPPEGAMPPAGMPPGMPPMGPPPGLPPEGMPPGMPPAEAPSPAMLPPLPPTA